MIEVCCTQKNERKKQKLTAERKEKKSIYITIVVVDDAWEDTRLIWCLSYPSGGAPLSPWALRFLVVREIDCGNRLFRRCMPAHQHCDLFYPLGHGDLLGSAVN